MMSVVHTFKLYEIINKYFRNRADSKAFISEVDKFISVRLESGNHDLATKADVKRLETEIIGLKNDVSSIRAEVSDVKSDVSKLEIKMGEGFKDILKWIIALMVAFASLIITCMKLLT